MGDFKGWESRSDTHFIADLGDVGKIEVYSDRSGRWSASVFKWSRHDLESAVEAKKIAIRMAHEHLARALNRLVRLEDQKD